MFTFKKTERLCSKKDIELLYNKGRNKTSFPLKLYWQTSVFDSPFPARVVISVPKRQFKKAPSRNRIKRQIREVYRLNKHLLYEQLGEKEKKLNLWILYVGNSFPTSTHLTNSLLSLFKDIEIK